MRKFVTGSVVLVLVGLAPLHASARPVDRATVVDQRVPLCRASGELRCAQSMVARYWYQRGSDQRRLSWVYASREPVSKGRAYVARWSYRVPGGAWKASGWKRLTHVPRARFAETGWGKGGRTGPAFPQGTQVCTEHKGIKARLCLTLK
ncbi:hypothetical protein [Streptomyces fradiae]|uniref:hypothetical protein n=1 Tax=Streptomyces fradiae TaxID=1906 RepID=UPI0035BE6609